VLIILRRGQREAGGEQDTHTSGVPLPLQDAFVVVPGGGRSRGGALPHAAAAWGAAWAEAHLPEARAALPACSADTGAAPDRDRLPASSISKAGSGRNKVPSPPHKLPRGDGRGRELCFLCPSLAAGSHPLRHPLLCPQGEQRLFSSLPVLHTCVHTITPAHTPAVQEEEGEQSPE